MCVGHQREELNIRLDGKEMKQVDGFVYLGGMVTEDTHSAAEVRCRTQAGVNAWRKVESAPATSTSTVRRGDVNIVALFAVIAFYLVIFLIGVFATWKSTNSVNLMLANREIGIVVGIFIMTGATLTVIVGLDDKWAIIISASVVLLYTIAGGLYSVILTDVFQLMFIIGGLWFAIPFHGPTPPGRR
ncbi:hypothetical protein LSAT2_009051 [Lamellibrachia satsuma]|nr:hypothetical protein LSAT2_009051 [Lamellibrachia satsuma]